MLDTFISSRLTPAGRWTSHDGRAVAEIAVTDLSDPRGAPVYEWTLRLDGVQIARSADLSGWEDTLFLLLHSFAGFLTAWVEALQWSDRAGTDSENSDLFDQRNAALRNWADGYADEFDSETTPEEDR